MVVAQWVCGLIGHDWIRAWRPRRLFTRCVKCGKESPGISVH